MITAFIVGRIIFGLYWLDAAYSHIFKSSSMVDYAKMKGVGSPKFAIIGSGLLALIGGVSILLGWYPTIGIIALIVFLLGVSFKMHAYWNVTDPMHKMGDQVNFTKNMALIGALLMMLAISQPWTWGM